MQKRTASNQADVDMEEGEPSIQSSTLVSSKVVPETLPTSNKSQAGAKDKTGQSKDDVEMGEDQSRADENFSQKSVKPQLKPNLEAGKVGPASDKILEKSLNEPNKARWVTFEFGRHFGCSCCAFDD